MSVRYSSCTTPLMQPLLIANRDNTKFILGYRLNKDGSVPTAFQGITSYTYSEIVTELGKHEWDRYGHDWAYSSGNPAATSTFTGTDVNQVRLLKINKLKGALQL
jgi:hypothetical protein